MIDITLDNPPAVTSLHFVSIVESLQCHCHSHLGLTGAHMQVTDDANSTKRMVWNRIMASVYPERPTLGMQTSFQPPYGCLDWGTVRYSQRAEISRIVSQLSGAAGSNSAQLQESYWGAESVQSLGQDQDGGQSHVNSQWNSHLCKVTFLSVCSRHQQVWNIMETVLWNLYRLPELKQELPSMQRKQISFSRSVWEWVY